MIRTVRQDDAAEIAEIYNDFVLNSTISFETEKISRRQMTERIAEISGKYPYFVHLSDGKIDGFCYAHQWKDRKAYDTTLETSIYISPARQHSGIGKLLMEHLLDECRRRNVYSLIACITAENLSSRQFHSRLGFKQVSLFEGVGLKFGRRLDVADYQLIL